MAESTDTAARLDLFEIDRSRRLTPGDHTSPVSVRWVQMVQDALEASEAERATLAAVIAEAPHDETCFAGRPAVGGCNCWKSRAGDPVVWQEHDAKVWEEGHEQGYDSGRYWEDDAPETLETRSEMKNPYRADAVEKENNRG